MNKIEQARVKVDTVLSGMTDDALRQAAIVHLYGVSSCCALLAHRRGLDSELAAVCGLLHDIYAYRAGTYTWHAQSGADMVRVILRGLGGFDEAQRQIVQSAVFHHSDKDIVHDAYDELLKDADILQPFLNNPDARIYHLARPRLERMAGELGLRIDFAASQAESAAPQPVARTDKRGLLADIAENLAARNITGDRNDSAYMDLLRYWPEDTAFDELKNGWCAAFVYHCCIKAGFTMPIRWQPGDDLRFACVAAWNTWAREDRISFFIKDTPGVLPQRGDIVLYRNIIPPQNKPENQRDVPTDHIGIVLGCDGEQYTIAEGNVNNQNQSAILTRPIHQNVEGYVRIDEGFAYDGWRYDYKTGCQRVVPFEGL